MTPPARGHHANACFLKLDRFKMLFERRTSSAERPLQLPLMADFETDPVASKGAKGLIGQQSGGTPVLRRLLVEMWDQAPAHALNARAPSRSITVAMDRSGTG
jgi:hypothetical protein